MGKVIRKAKVKKPKKSIVPYMAEITKDHMRVCDIIEKKILFGIKLN
jgi:hypothetical protein